MVLGTVGSIASHIASKWVLPAGVSGALIETVGLQKIKVQNFAGVSISSDAISEEYQDIITDFSKADVLEEAFAWASTVSTSGGAVIISAGASSRDKLKLGDMDVSTEGTSQTAALNFLSALSKDTPTKLREQATASMDNLGIQSSYYKALG